MHYDPERALEEIHAAESIVVGQLGQTLDGRVATESGESLYINGVKALEHLHRLRAAVDAVIVGVGTIVADDPRLTVRLCEGRTPKRVIIDPRGRVPPHSQCLNDKAGTAMVIRHAGLTDAADLPSRASVVEVKKNDDRSISWNTIINLLSEHGMRKVLIEGGPHTLSLALAEGAIELLHVMVAPKILGSGKPGLCLPPVQRLDDALALESRIWQFDDGDVLFTCCPKI